VDVPFFLSWLPFLRAFNLYWEASLDIWFGAGGVGLTLGVVIFLDPNATPEFTDDLGTGTGA
jgi:hypothetical protein